MTDSQRVPPKSTLSRISNDLQSAIEKWEQWESSEKQTEGKAKSRQGLRPEEVEIDEVRKLLKELQKKMKELNLG